MIFDNILIKKGQLFVCGSDFIIFISHSQDRKILASWDQREDTGNASRKMVNIIQCPFKLVNRQTMKFEEIIPKTLLSKFYTGYSFFTFIFLWTENIF